MRYIIYFLLLFPFIGQSQSRVSGVIVDSLTDETIVGAYVLLKADPSIGAVSDVFGNFKLDLSEGEHTLIVKFTGMLNDTIQVNLGKGEDLKLRIVLSSKTLNKVDIVVGKFDQKVEELTYSMEVIKPALIEDKNTRSIETILDQTPGLNIMDGEPQIRGGSGFTFGVGSKVAVIVDDMPMLSGDAGRPEWGFIPVENIEQIEVVKGASSVLSGASALSGAIHIRTAYPKAKPMTKVNLYSGFYSPPSDDSANWWGNDYPYIHGVNFLHSRIIKKNTDLVFGGNMNFDHGYIGGPIVGPYVYDTTLVEYGNKEMASSRYRFNFNLRQRSNKIQGLHYGINGNFMKSKTNLTLAWLDDSTGIYRAYPGAVLLQDQTIFNVDPYIEFYSKIGVKHSLRTRYLYTDNQMSSNQSNFTQVIYTDYQFKKAFSHLKDQAFDFIGGFSNQYNSTVADLYNNDQDSTHYLYNLSGYAEIQKKFFDALNFSIGVRGEYYKLNDTLTAWNPIFRTGANLKLTQATFLRASYGQGYRFPTITERYISTSVGAIGVFENPEIKPEKSWNAEVGVNQGYKIGKYLGQLDIAAFIQEYENTIEYLFGFWDPSPDFAAGDPLAGFKFVNTGKSQITGFDITLNGEGSIGKDFKFRHQVGYNYINPITLEPDLVFAQDYNPGNPQDFSFNNTSYDTTTNVLKYRFKHTFKADVEFNFKGFSLGYTVKYFSRLENLDQAIIDFENVTIGTGGTLQPLYYQDFYEEHQNGNLIMDLRFSYKFGGSIQHKLSIVCKNLMNETYSLRPLKIEPLRSTVLQYSIKF